MGKLFYLDESRYFYTRLQNQTKDAADAKKAGIEGCIGEMLAYSGQATSFFYILNTTKL